MVNKTTSFKKKGKGKKGNFKKNSKQVATPGPGERSWMSPRGGVNRRFKIITVEA